jgi:adenosylcobinamide kinase/adenosylcobinamide-phosphate guanylyltransferase
MLNRSELILGGQRSGKSRRAELLARDWLAQSPTHRSVLIATATAWDDEMAARIARHQQDRAERVPGIKTVEEPLELARAIAQHSAANTVVVVDCLTLWLTNLLMPHENAENSFEAPENSRNYLSNKAVDQQIQAYIASFLIAIKNAPGPVILVGNEIGLGVIPMGRETRAFVDVLGRLNQDVAATCERVTFMAAGLPLTLKGQP